MRRDRAREANCPEAANPAPGQMQTHPATVAVCATCGFVSNRLKDPTAPSFIVSENGRKVTVRAGLPRTGETKAGASERARRLTENYNAFAEKLRIAKLVAAAPYFVTKPREEELRMVWGPTMPEGWDPFKAR